ncbi:glycosyltransferase family 57 protein [Babjeviella inositovora NRRL Y-12698]|uniref:Alpha-1,3-glucosyltransferase n=1 Tax=Babjeviella inositovora NRRL Y-12698 TaxID=984486 RepID=A0A1E3QH66_9ASCO|nr:glycosyltransferase family 57 protein [Babjeviella inositovora NRRL Y-12698]ODQ77039.1 glycosyltransferase family 57 protein [Babjeviella inositovora NRRL Y-12698]
MPFRPAPNQWAARYIIIVFTVIIRCGVGLGSYSGMGSPPIHGDFEAQRHWMEITTHLPMKEWYFYDLQYWGLDYPPLTTYHSWVLGKVGSFINPAWFTLVDSRMFESENLKSYMRYTAIASEVLVYYPAVFGFARWMAGKYHRQPAIDQTIAVAAILFQPSLILVDHGHFQYNSVMLGLTLLAIVQLLHDNYALAAIAFTCSLFFKQMALYYAPFIFAYMLSVCVWPLSRFNLLRLLSVGISVLVTSSVMLLPLVYSAGRGNTILMLQQVMLRVFPFSRGIFEDKVGNFWCATNTFVKYKNLFDTQQLQFYSFIATIAAIVGPCTVIFLYPRKHLLPWGFAAVSWAFYLFSFQVHEKSVLIPLMPTTLLFCDNDAQVLAMVAWINNIGLFSMWPLLKKDGLSLQYTVVGLLFNWLIGSLDWISLFLPKFIIPGLTLLVVDHSLKRDPLPKGWFWRPVTVLSTSAAVAIHLCDAYVTPPASLPDIWVVANVTLCFGSFALFFLWTCYKMIALRNAETGHLILKVN